MGDIPYGLSKAYTSRTDTAFGSDDSLGRAPTGRARISRELPLGPTWAAPYSQHHMTSRSATDVRLAAQLCFGGRGAEPEVLYRRAS